MITQARLKELLHYNSETGVFTWKISRQGINVDTMIAGTNHQGYIRIRVDNKCYRAHRLAWLYVHGQFPLDQLDHIDHNRNNNAILNLRPSTLEINNRNASKHKKNSSGVTGVYWHKGNKKWRALIFSTGKLINLGSFDVKDDAIKARAEANIKYGFHQNHGQ